MMHHITWKLYAEVTILLLIIYYCWLIRKYYLADLRRLFHLKPHEENERSEIPAALKYHAPVPEPEAIVSDISAGNPENQPDNALEEADELIRELKQVIQTSAAKPFTPAVLIPQIKKLFQQYRELQRSPHRPAINELVVSECERLGTALLTEDEVDQWWNE